MSATPDAPARRWLDYLDVEELAPDPRNPKNHADADLDSSLERFGYTEPILLDERTGLLVSGHGRRLRVIAAKESGKEPPEGVAIEGDRWLVPVTRGWASKDDAEAGAYLIAANRLTERGGWNVESLASLLDDVAKSASGLQGVGYSAEEMDALLESATSALPGGGAQGGQEQPAGPTLADRFLIPPFSVFDARQGYWQERKRRWLALGIRSEDGRPTNLLNMSEQVSTSYGAQASVAADGSLVYEPSVGLTSIFDPVLCEIAYRWWCPEQGRVLDPFAGGSVRGIVAAMLERSYIGVDLSPTQVEANEEQGARVLGERGLRSNVEWVVGDSLEVLPSLEAGEPFDFVFTCPPYFDLEQYSEDPADLSNFGSYEDFLAGYRQIIASAVASLADDRFAAVVVGDIRGPDGIYRGFVPDTIAAFTDAGCSYYNDVVLVTAVGSLALRAGRIFNGARKVGKAHQNVLVFVKGDPQAAAAACAPVDISAAAELFGSLVGEEELDG